MYGVTLWVVILQIFVNVIHGCGEDQIPAKEYNARLKRDRLSENVVIGMDYLGKPKIVCHCNEEEVWRLKSKMTSVTRRANVAKVKGSSSHREQQQDVIYSPSCCKIDLSNPRKLYSYPFTLRLPGQTYGPTFDDPNSPEFQNLKQQLISGLTQLLSNEGCVVQIDITKFRPGSVLADVVLTVQGPISQSIIDTLKAAVDSGNIGGLRVQVVPEMSEKPTTTPAPGGPAPEGTAPAAAPPQGGTTPTPPQGGTTTKPPQGGTTPTPPQGGTATKPAQGGTTPTPAQGTTTPAQGTTTPAQGATTPTPAQGATTPAQGATTPTPAQGVTTPTTAQGATTPTPAQGATTPTPKQSTATPSPAQGATTPTPKQGATTPTPKQGATTTTQLQGATTPTPKQGATTPTPQTTTATTPKPAAATTKPGTTQPATEPSVQVLATLAPATQAPVTTNAPVTTAAPVMEPETPVDIRPTIAYNRNTPGKEIKVAIVLSEKSFDRSLGDPSSAPFLELKKMLEQSLIEVFRINPYFLSLTVVSFRPAVSKPPKQKVAKAMFQLRDNVPLLGVEVTLDIKFREAAPDQLTPLETQLKIGSIASHKVLHEMAAVIIKDQSTSTTSCPSNCRQPSVCFPQCSSQCCSPPQAQPSSCPKPCASSCSPTCTASCCALTKRSTTER